MTIWIVIVAAAIVGGVFMEVIEIRWRRKQEEKDREELKASARRG